MPTEIRRVEGDRGLKAFIQFQYDLYKGNAYAVPPLYFDELNTLSKKRNPAFEFCEAEYWMAYKDGKAVGRVAGIYNPRYVEKWGLKNARFGWIDFIDDPEVSEALLRTVEDWARSKGMEGIVGPMGFTDADKEGMLVEGFEHPPMLSMAHSRPYQGKLAEACGFEKEKDLLCWKYSDEMEFNARTMKAWESVKALPEVRLRGIDMSRLAQDMADLVEVYNDAWAGKWAFVPIMQDEVDKMVKDLKMILDPDIAFVAEVNGKVAGVCIMIPNLNEVIQDFGGKLFPINWAKMLWRIKVKRPKTTRLMLLGLNHQVRANMKRYGGLSAAMYVEVAKRGKAKGYKWCEMSWTREDDAPINLGIKSMGAQVYKKYRVYKKELA